MIELNKDKPLVILLDLDKTIQGDVNSQVNEFNLIRFLNSTTKNKKLTQNKKDVIQDMKNGLMRPHFKRFIVKMKKRFPTIEFFIYTASDDIWGNYIGNIIQDTIGIKFNKRIFTRSDCVFDSNLGIYMKSIKKITPEIFKILKKKYKLKNERDIQTSYLIDNSKVLYPDEINNLIKCDDYNSEIVIDLLRNLPKGYIEKNYNIISKFILKKDSNSLIEFYGDYYSNLHKEEKKQNDLNKKINFKDKFWKIILKELKRQFNYK